MSRRDRPPETAFTVDSYVREVELEGKRIATALIISSGTMDKYGIALGPEEGVKAKQYC